MGDVLTVPLPYELRLDELKVDPAAEDRPGRIGRLLIELSDSWGEEELRRVVVSTALLISRDREVPLVSALETAMIWERG